MNLTEYKLKLAEEIIEDHDYINNKYLTLKVDTVKQLRNLVIQFIVISSAIIGFTLPIINQTQLVKNNTLLVGGLAELLIVILYGFFYLKKILEEENNTLEKDHEAFSKYLDKKRDAKVKFMKDIGNPEVFKIYEEENTAALAILDSEVKRKNKSKDYSLDILFIGFFVALMLIVFSLMDTNMNILGKSLNL